MSEYRFRRATGTRVPLECYGEHACRSICRAEGCQLEGSRFYQAPPPLPGGIRSSRIPPMPEGFTDQTAWDAIHWKFSDEGSLLDQAVTSWQRENQERVQAAIEAERKQNEH